MPAKRAARGSASQAKKATSSRKPKAQPAKPGPRKDKGEGEAAVQARIASLGEPSRSILERLHPIIMAHGKQLEPVVRWGFLMYRRDGRFQLIAAPRKAYVSFGTPTDGPARKVATVIFASPDEVDERRVAAVVRRVLG